MGYNFTTSFGPNNPNAWSIEFPNADPSKIFLPRTAWPIGNASAQKITSRWTDPAGKYDAIYDALWWIDPDYGLTLDAGHFSEKLSIVPHLFARNLQWRNHRLFFRGALQRETSSREFKLQGINPQTGALASHVVEVCVIDSPSNPATAGPAGQSAGKQFAFCLSALFRIPNVSLPGRTRVYNAKIRQTILVAVPDVDQDPAGAVVAVKIYPILEFCWERTPSEARADRDAGIGANPEPICFGADLRIELAPRLTRSDQHRAATFYSPNPPLDYVVSAFCDTNLGPPTRPIPGTPDPTQVLLVGQAVLAEASATVHGDWAGILAANKALATAVEKLVYQPYWNSIFDYVQADIRDEFFFHAALPDGMPPPPSGKRTFTINWAPSGAPITCKRDERQGEFDNLHIHPYVGFDDPKAAAGTTPGTPLVEAPVAADEVFHLHWRWGEIISPSAAAKSPAEFRGYNAQMPNVTAGAPLIPGNQWLIVKVGAVGSPQTENANDPGTNPAPLTPGSVIVWYSPAVIDLAEHQTALFFAHGYGHGFLLDTAVTSMGIPHTKLRVTVTNTNLLESDYSAPVLGTHAAGGYHDFRWTDTGAQRAANATPNIADPNAIQQQCLSKNRIGINGDPDVDSF